MRKKSLRTGAVLALAVLAVLPVLLRAEIQIIRVTVENASVRTKPDMQSNIIRKLDAGTLLKAQKKVGDWYEVAFQTDEGISVVGYIHEMFVEVEKPEVKPQRVEQADAGFKRMGLGLYVGGSSTSDYGSGLAYGANFYFGLTKNIGIEVGGLRFQMTTKDNDDMTKLSKGKLAVMPFELSLMARFPVGAKIVPYVAGGAGYNLNKFTLDGNLVKSWSDLGLDLNESIDHSVGYHIGAGLDYFFNPRIAIAANVKYCQSNAKGSWTLTDTRTGVGASGRLSNLKLGAIIFGIGMKYTF